MANEVDDIVQNIVLTGNAEVSEAFNKIQEAGTHAFEAIAEAAEKGLGSFSGIGIALGGVAAAFGIVTTAAFAFEKEMAETVSQMSDLADATGTTTEVISGLRAAFAAGGVGAEQLQSAFRHLSITSQQSWTEIKQASRQSADQLRGDALAVSQAQLQLSQSLQALGNIQRDQGLQSRQSTLSLADAKQKLSEVEEKQLAAAGADTSGLQQINQAEAERLELKRAQLAVAQAQKAKDDEAQNQADAIVKAQNDAEQAQLSLNAARRKAEDDQKNDINNVIDAVKRVAEGQKDALKDINASADNVVKGIIGSTANAGKAIGQLRGDITDLSSPAPEVQSLFLKLGEVLKNVEDPALRTAVAFRLLGRSVGQDFLNVLSDPSKIEEFKKRVEELGLAVDHADKEVSEKFRESLFTLENDIQLIAVKIATALGPSLTDGIKSLDELIINNKDAIIGAFKAIADAIGPVVDAVKSALGVIKDAFNGIGEGAGKAAGLINQLFGTNLDTNISTWSIVLSGLKTEFDLLATAINAVVEAVKIFKDVIGLGDGSHLSAGLETAKNYLTAIKDILSGDVQKGMDEWKEATQKQSDTYKKLAEDEKKRSTDQKTAKADSHAKDTEASKKEVDDHAKAHDAMDARSKKSADQHVADVNKEVAANKALAESQTKSSTASTTTTAGQSAPNIPIGSSSPFNEANGFKQLAPGVLSGRDNTIDITPGRASQSAIDKAIQSIPAKPIQTRDDFQADMDKQIEALRKDWESQSKFNDNMARQGATPSPVDDNGVSGSYPPPVHGHYDQNGGFVPSNPSNVGYGFTPKSNDYQFGGRSNPAGPYQPGISAPVSFPDYIKDKLTSLPQNIPLPTPRPGGSDITDAVKQGVQEGIATQQGQGEPFGPEVPFPGLPQAPPLAPELQGEQSLGDKFSEGFSKLGDILQGIKDSSIFSGKSQPTQDAPPVQDLTSSLTESVQSAADAFTGISNSGAELAGTFNDLDSSGEKAATQLDDINYNPGSVAAAGGGHITGPGSETSDSIPAMLSHNEYVHPAAATRHYGLEFMNAVRNLSFPKTHMKAGGLVGVMPRYMATGGVANLAGIQSYTIPHLGSVDLSTSWGNVPVMLNPQSLSALKQAAVMKSMGKPVMPSWMR